MEGNKNINYTFLLTKLKAKLLEGPLKESKIKKNVQKHYCHVKMFQKRVKFFCIFSYLKRRALGMLSIPILWSYRLSNINSSIVSAKNECQ
jgi:hypothetical protein